MRELGWIAGRNIAIEYRWAGGRNERLAEFAEEFVRLKADLIRIDGGATASSDISKLLQDFLKSIQDSKGSSSARYSTEGNSLAAQIQSLIVNYQA